MLLISSRVLREGRETKGSRVAVCGQRAEAGGAWRTLRAVHPTHIPHATTVHTLRRPVLQPTMSLICFNNQTETPNKLLRSPVGGAGVGHGVAVVAVCVHLKHDGACASWTRGTAMRFNAAALEQSKTAYVPISSTMGLRKLSKRHSNEVQRETIQRAAGQERSRGGTSQHDGTCSPLATAYSLAYANACRTASTSMPSHCSKGV